MSSIALRQALGRAARELGVRAQSTAPAAALGSKALNDFLPTSGDTILQPYYEQLTRLRVVPGASPKEASPSEVQAELGLLRLHNSSLPASVMEGHMVKAQVLEVSRRGVTLDTGLRPARVARADLPPDSIIGTTVADSTPRKHGELREGDVVQVFLEAAGTLEGDMQVSGVQSSVARRTAAVWGELEERARRGELVRGRILNSTWRGYAVGVAGVVGFLPAKQCSRPTARRIGQLQKFRILEADPGSSTLVLADPNLHYMPSQPAQRQRRPPRSEAEAARRQELARVADELRSVLAMRRDSGGDAAA